MKPDKYGQVYDSMARVLRMVSLIHGREPLSPEALLTVLSECEDTIPGAEITEVEYAAWLAGLIRKG